ncbi:beta-xylosidase [Lederbergia lenta]|uniref:Beta-xylosidase n=3 Tax=Lederbergia lenta TaxID=1467 RepID=A0A2X4WWX4_LEDLE|nr:beta-xylosidase [Lederbergia lenta]
MKKNHFYRMIICFMAMVFIIPSSVFANTKEVSKPVFKEVSVHDPSIIKKDDMYYVFGSHIDAAKSTDLMNWTTFTNGYTTPNNVIYGDLSKNLAGSFAWAGENDSDSKGGYSVWAPEAFWNENYLNEDGTKGAYMMYYSASSTYIRSAIGYAVSKNIEGPYTYVDTIIYSGFTKDEAYDKDSKVNKKWTNTNIKDLVDNDILGGESSSWFNKDGSYANGNFPNAIDANLFYDENGKLWMTYGSWSGGIFILEIDKVTGKAIYPREDGTTTDGRLIDRYFGTKISGGFGKSGEGPYVVYDKNTGYYYLYVTYGWLASDGEYNMRLFRSKNPTGPYVDAMDQNAVLPGNVDHAPYGNKLIGHFLFERKVGDPGTGVGYGYVSAGHNSVYLDPQTGQQLLVFHTRFPQRGEAHELRIHQMFMNEDGWPVVAPYRYSGETLDKVNKADLVGAYQFVNHGKDNSNVIKKANTILLNEEGTVSGLDNAKWELKGDYHATLTIGDDIYKGMFLRQWNSITESYSMTFTALSNKGESIWGIKTLDRTDEELVEIIKDELSLGDTTGVMANLSLPTTSIGDAKISWKSSHPDIVSEQGVVNRPGSDKRDAHITLTATISKGAISTTKAFDVVVLAMKEGKLVAYYPFDDNLEDRTKSGASGTITGDKVDNMGGTITYSDGKKGKAALFDGQSGVLLPKSLISSDKYTVSLWLNPEELTEFTTTFFGATATNHWISFLPTGPVDGETMLWSGENWYDAPVSMTMNKNEWTHMAFNVDKGKVDVYINGVEKFSGTDFPNVFTSNDAIFALGVNYWDTPYKGLMDELLIYDNMTLSEKEIKNYYEAGEFPGLEKTEDEKKEIDKKKLEALINEAKKIKNDNNKYTVESYQTLEAAIVTAESELDVIDSEESLARAIASLQAAMDGLKEVESKPKEDNKDQEKKKDELQETTKDKGKEVSKPHNKEGKLPNTATSLYNMLFIGIALIMLGGVSFFVVKIRSQKKQ